MNFSYKLINNCFDDEEANLIRAEIFNDIITPQFFYYNEFKALWVNIGKPNEDREMEQYAIYINDELIGYYSIKWYERFGKKAYLKYIIIKEIHQRKGYGTKIMKYIIKSIREEQANNLILKFNPDIIGLKEFYIGLGFKEVKDFLNNYWEKKFRPKK